MSPVRGPAALWLLLAAAALLLQGCGGQTPYACKQDDGATPLFTVSAMDSLEASTVVEVCVAKCKMESYTYAAITENRTCQCTASDTAAIDALADSPAVLCAVTCTDGLACGGLEAAAMSIYETGGGSMNFTMTVTHVPTTSLSLALAPLTLTDQMYYIDLGTGTELVQVNASGSPFATVSYIIPGTYTITAVGMVEGVKEIFTVVSDPVVVTGTPTVDKVTCPFVWEPDEVFNCNVSVTLAAPTDAFTGSFVSDDQTVLQTFAGVGATMARMGELVPLGFSPTMSPSGDAMTTVVTFTEYSISRPSVIYAVELYAMEAGAYEWQVDRPACAAGLLYCVFAGGCLATCPYDSLNNLFSCLAPASFCPFRSTCGTAGTCAAPGAAATAWTPVAIGSIAATGPGGFRETLAVAVDLFPGDTLKVTGNLAIRSELYAPGDTVDGAATTGHRMVGMVIKELMPLQLPHTCLVVNNDVTLTVGADAATTSTQNNLTYCQRNITDIALDVVDTNVYAFDPDLNLLPDYYVWAGATYIPNFNANFSVAGPIDITVVFDPTWGTNVTHPDPTDFPLTAGSLHTLLVPFSIPSEGTYVATMTAENLHNLEYAPPQASITIIAQYPVLPDWLMAPVASAYLVPDTVPTFTFTDADPGDFPTDASVLIDWMDGTGPEVLPFTHTGDNTPVVTHIYASDGIYSPEVFIYNKVSSFNTSCTVTIIEAIQDFAITNGYFSSDTATEAREGFGKIKHQYPLDKNLTFFPAMTQGTVETYEVRHTGNNSIIFSFTTADMFDPLADSFLHHFDFEVLLNITVFAINPLQTESVDLFLEIVGHVKALLIDDFAITSKPNEEKLFEFSFESLGGGTCLVVDWGDGSNLDSFGDELTCKKNFSHAAYNSEPLLEEAMNFTHSYPGGPDPTFPHQVYNISGFAYNAMSFTEDMLLFVITDLQCTAPKATIADQVLDYAEAMPLFKGEDNTIVSIGSINCNVTQKTKKRWQIIQIDPKTGAHTFPIIMMNIIPSWNKPEMVIPKGFLSYGHYMILYTITMWDPEVLDPSIVFQKQTETYIEITRTPLIGKMTANSISKVKRGPSQVVDMEPGVHSIDPDFVDEKNFTLLWRCRKEGEAWPAPGDAPKPLTPLGATGTGCFGHGPGTLDHTEKTLSLKGVDFDGVGTYEFEAIVGKDIRTTTAVMQVEVSATDVPIIEVNCLVASLCTPSAEGGWVIVNPTSRLAMLSSCVAACTGGTTTQWSAQDEALNPLTIPGDSTANEFVLEADTFFAANPGLAALYLTADVTNSLGDVGSNSYYMKINQPPVAPYHDPAVVPVPSTAPNTECQVYPGTGNALIDTFTLTCDDWTDPDNIGIVDYRVELLYPVAPPAEAAPPTVLMEKSHINSGSQTMLLVFPASTFDINVVITDKWGAYTEHRAAVEFVANMITEEELNNGNVDQLLASLAGAGNSAMMTMVIAAQSSITTQASWLNLTDPSLTPEELRAMQLLIAKQNQNALQFINDNTNFDDMGGLQAASGAVAQIMDAASASPEAALTIGLDSRDMVIDILENVGEGVKKQGTTDMNVLDTVITDISTIAAGIVMGYDEILGSEGCLVVPEIDYAAADYLHYDTDIGYDYDMVVPATLSEAKQCNVKDTTKVGASSTVDRANVVVKGMGSEVMKLMVVGDSKTIDSGNGMTMTINMLDGFSLEGVWWCGDCTYIFLKHFCPQGPCNLAVGVIAIAWPASTYQAPGSASLLADGTEVLDLDLYYRNQTKIIVKDSPQKIGIHIPRTMEKRGGNTMPEFQHVNATYESKWQKIPVMYSTFWVNETRNSATVEIIPDDATKNLCIVLSKGRMPTLRNHSHYWLVKDMPSVTGTNISEWFLNSYQLGGKGQYFLGVGEFAANVTDAKAKTPTKLVYSDVQKFTANYKLRVYTSGCYFRNPSIDEWINDDLEVLQSNYTRTACETHHLTSFGAGFMVTPNTIDFSYVFAHMGFVDNLTIYVTIGICIAMLILLLIWARWQDSNDEKKVGATPLPDNHLQDKYLYEILVFTGNKMEAQTDSTVRFTLHGDYGESDIRTFGDSERKIFRKSATDAFVMANDRPLGSLQYLRIWHDNSGKGPNASWYLNYIVVRDVQTGDKYEFICNDWFAVEKGGLVDRVLPIARPEDKAAFKHVFSNVSNKNIADSHLWFSVFMRPHRSRYTRCQRVGSCFALLFLSMLVNAMFYDTVPDAPMSGGLNFGPFSFTQEQMGVGFLSNLLVFPPSFLIVFLFRKSQPRVLRESRINKAIARTVENLDAKKVDKPEETAPAGDMHEKVEKKRKKKLVLPWWCNVVAWVLVVVCILGSLFFLLMYGIMFGNNKATNWIMSLVITFFTSVLFVEPIKIALLALFFSTVCKRSDMDEDDVEYDEEHNPELESNQEWLYDDKVQRQKLYRRKLDTELIEKMKKQRKNENEMHAIIKELLVYMFFIYVLLYMTYGHRDPNAWLLRENLRHSMIHEGLTDGTDYLKATDTNHFWNFMHIGFFGFLRADVHYNGKSPYQLRGFLNDQANRIMGYATIRQIRAKKFSCHVPKDMRYLTRDCSTYSNLVNEESKHYCADWKLPTNATKNTKACRVEEFRYATAASLKSLPLWGQRDWYGGGGYVIHLRAKTIQLYKKFTYLQENHWIDKMTRAVLIEFATYNAGSNLFGVATMLAEITPGGGISPYYRFDGVRLLQHNSSFSLFTYIMQGLFIFFAIYFTVKELAEMYKLRGKYFDSYWSFAELALIIAAYTAIILYVLRYIETDKAMKTFNETWGNGYIRLTYAVTINEYYGYTLSFMAFVGTLKFIKLLRFNKRVGILSATLRRCWDDLSSFLMAFFLCFFSFVFLFFVLLNGVLDDFYNIISAIETSFSMMLGKFQFEEMKNANALVPLLFFVFVLCNSWVLINLLLTLIIKAFEEVKRDILSKPSEYEILDFVWRNLKAMVGKGNVEEIGSLQLTSTEKEGLDKDGDNTVTGLPDKMDKFLEYVNENYFDGTLDMAAKREWSSQMDGKKPYNRGIFDQTVRTGPIVGE